MPAAGSCLRHGHRDHIYTKAFYKKLKSEKPLTLTYKQCADVIRVANTIVSDIIMFENDGYKLSRGLGYLCAVKYKPLKDNINWKKTNELGIKVPYLNLDTLGYSIRVQWFRVGRVSNAYYHELFKFKAVKKVSKKVSKSFKQGKSFLELRVRDFREKSRLQNLYNKKFKELKQN